MIRILTRYFDYRLLLNQRLTAITGDNKTTLQQKNQQIATSQGDVVKTDVVKTDAFKTDAFKTDAFKTDVFKTNVFKNHLKNLCIRLVSTE